MNSRGASSPPTSESSTDVGCPICLAHEFKALSPGRDRLFGLAPGTFLLFRCVSCDCIFQHPFPDDAALPGFYPQDYWWSEGAASENRWARLFQGLEKAYREFVVADHVRFLDSCARQYSVAGRKLLDIGCSSGTFLHVAQSRGYMPHGMDRSAKAVEIANNQYGYDIREGGIGDTIWGDQRFDFVTMFHVLEHLTDPRLGLEYAGDLLKSDGILIIQVPNVSSIQARIFGNSWYGLDVPRHVINYAPKALSHLLRQTGFDFRLISRFSLRDNPASVASSLVPWLDPIRRKGRRLNSHPILSGAMEAAYFALYLLALPPAYLESVFGMGGTIWACAWKKQ